MWYPINLRYFGGNKNKVFIYLTSSPHIRINTWFSPEPSVSSITVAKWWFSDSAIPSKWIDWQSNHKEKLSPLPVTHSLTCGLSVDAWIPTVFNSLWSVTVIIYFDAQTVPGLASGSSLTLPPVRFRRAPTFFRHLFSDFPGGSDGKESACNAEDPGLIPGSGRSPGEEIGYPLQSSCLENPMDRGAWRDTVHVVAKSRTRLSD